MTGSPSETPSPPQDPGKPDAAKEKLRSRYEERAAGFSESIRRETRHINYIALARLAADAGADMLAPAIARCEAAGVPHVAEVATGDPVPMLLELVEKHRCQGVLMGSHGKGLVRSSWLGSVSQAMLEGCPVPVTFVKARSD